MTSGEKVERLVVAAVGGLELVPEAELPLVLQLQADNRLAQGASVLADDTQGSTFEKLKFLEKISTYKRVTEVQEESPEAHPFTVGIAGVGSGADVAHGHLWSNVKVAVDGQHGAPKVSDSFGEEFVGGVLQELLQEELCRGCQKGVLTVGSTDVLQGQDRRHAL